MEYVGEVLDYEQFVTRSKRYGKDSQLHYYFMALNTDEIIDATYKGNVSRFINHSCDPNCETQKVGSGIHRGNAIKFKYVFLQFCINVRCDNSYKHLHVILKS